MLEVLEELGNAQKVRIGGLVQLTVRVKPAQKARKGRNPATGDEITIAAKPAREEHRYESPAKGCCGYRAASWSWSREASKKRPTAVS